ncbi:hypothetical protein BH10BAC4_BH10BAC4_15760 [soil metagenome]
MYYLLNIMMMWKSIKYPISFAFFGLLVSSCFQSDYTKLVKSELAKGVRQDSLLLGIRFGDTQNDFFGKCYDLNRAGTVYEGSGAGVVRYPLMDSMFHNKPTDIRFLFKPDYDEKQVISQMVYDISYSGWAPWNKDLQSDSLKPKVIKLLMNWYKGNEFIPVEVEGEDLLVKVDGNRRMLVYIFDTQTVVVKIQDLLNPMFAPSVDSKHKRAKG